MKRLVILFYISTLSGLMHAQISSEGGCSRFEINCMTSYFMAQRPQDVMSHPDTSFTISIQENVFLNDFLSAHTTLQTNADSPQYDIRTVFSFGDKSEVKHILGFDCFGDYYLDGKYFSVNDKIKIYEGKLKIGF